MNPSIKSTDLYNILSTFQTAPEGLNEMKNYDTPQAYWDATQDVNTMIWLMAVADQYGWEPSTDETFGLIKFCCDCIANATFSDGTSFISTLSSSADQVLTMARDYADYGNTPLARIREVRRSLLRRSPLRQDDYATSAVCSIPLTAPNIVAHVEAVAINCQVCPSDEQVLQRIVETGNLQPDTPFEVRQAETAQARAMQADLLRKYMPKFPAINF